MRPQTWEKINELFHSAFELPEEDRQEFLRLNCDSPAVLSEVAALLASNKADSGFLRSPVFDAGLKFIAAPEDFTGERIGAYQIVGELGRGGMGVVYQATRADGAFEHRVAVKLLPASPLSDRLRTRFERERQILANLNHPNIARLFDGGEIAGGTPYFVMELVRGAPITEFGRTLPTNARLKLFLKVCETVEYAHRQGVVHRDLKPSNILIDENGEPKLLDFGIAKFMSDAEPGDTTTGFSFLTPEYASPEQVSGLPVTEQTDVYSLGIILYELLADRRPYEFENRSPAGIASVICGSEPLKPSTAKNRRNTAVDNGQADLIPTSDQEKRLSSDLDLITLAALRKDPAMRFASVGDLADDVRRFLSGEPVKAAPDRLVYRAMKFTRRHRGAVFTAAAASVVLALLVPMAIMNMAASGISRRDGARRVTMSGTKNFLPQMLADGKIAFLRTSVVTTRARSGDERTDFFVVNADGSNEHLLHEGLTADRGKFSPDGKYFAYRDTNDYRLHIADADFRSERKLTQFAAGRPAWAHDGQRLMFSYDLSQKLEETTMPVYQNGDNVEIFVVNADGSGETNLTNNPAFDSDASISPDGTCVVFASNRDGNFEIYEMNVDGSGQQRLTVNDVDDVQPTWSPDGRRIAFVSRRAGENDQIFTMRPDGTDVKRITDASGNDGEPQWSPDGRQLVFHNDEGSMQIYLIDVPAE